MACVEADGWRMADGATLLNTVAEQIRSAVREREGGRGRTGHATLNFDVPSPLRFIIGRESQWFEPGGKDRVGSFRLSNKTLPMPNGGTEKAEETR